MISRQERMLSLGVRTGRLPERYHRRVYAEYLRLAGGASGDPNAHALTDDEIDELERVVIVAEFEAWQP